MMKYDPNKPPDTADWFVMDEAERIDLVAIYHKRIREKLPNARIHATVHVIIENQLAEGVAVVIEALGRLMAEGLDRHDAVHAIGSVLAKHMFSLLRGELSGHDPNEPYFRDLSSLTASSWMKGAS